MQVAKFFMRASPVLETMEEEAKAAIEQGPVSALDYATRAIKQLISLAEELADEAKAGAAKKNFVMQAFGQMLSSLGTKFLGFPRWVGWFVTGWIMNRLVPVLIDRYVEEMFPNDAETN